VETVEVVGLLIQEHLLEIMEILVAKVIQQACHLVRQQLLHLELLAQQYLLVVLVVVLVQVALLDQFKFMRFTKEKEK
jgi:hypothetical protein